MTAPVKRYLVPQSILVRANASFGESVVLASDYDALAAENETLLLSWGLLRAENEKLRARVAELERGAVNLEAQSPIERKMARARPPFLDQKVLDSASRESADNALVDAMPDQPERAKP